MMTPYILVVEDDHLQDEPLSEHLRDEFPGGRVVNIRTELEFQDRLQDFREDAPDIAVMDVMLRWALPTPDMRPPPPQVAEEGFYRAGLRCAELFAEDSGLCAVPVIFYTILERSDLEQDGVRLQPNSLYVRKSPDMDILVRKIREQLAKRG
jgi:DNA-binding NarL/FixJ family response regulator